MDVSAGAGACACACVGGGVREVQEAWTDPAEA